MKYTDRTHAFPNNQYSRGVSMQTSLLLRHVRERCLLTLMFCAALCLPILYYVLFSGQTVNDFSFTVHNSVLNLFNGYSSGVASTNPDRWDDSIVLWKLELEEIKKKSVKGTIMEYLKDYKNPCWFEEQTSPEGLRCIPYFYVLGVGRAGTSAACRELSKHPHVIHGARKEYFFWNFARGARNISTYAEEFSQATWEIFHQVDAEGYHPEITFDATPGYLVNSGPVGHIPGNLDHHTQEPRYTMAHTLYKIYQGTRLVILLRNPTDRLFSHYHQVSDVKFDPDFFHDEAVHAISIMNRCLSTRSLRSCAFDFEMNSYPQIPIVPLSQGMYYPYVKEWLSVFPREQVFFVESEDFFEHATDVVTDLYSFLDLDEATTWQMKSVEWDMHGFNKLRNGRIVKGVDYSVTIRLDTQKMLDAFYQPYNELLAHLLGDDRWRFERSKAPKVITYT